MKILLFLCLLSGFSCTAQLVNIESQRIQSDSIRAAGNANINFSYQKTNGIASAHFRTALAFQLKSKSLRHIYLILGSYDLARSFNMTSNHAGFGHLRYNYKINKWLRWEVYTQIQFNQLLSLKYRALGGTGARFKLNKGKLFKTYVGISAFYEYEEITKPAHTFNSDVRISTYGVISWKFPKDKGEFTSITYYQPNAISSADFRITSQNSLVLNLAKRLAFITQFNYFMDTRPPEDVNREVFSLENGLRFSL